MKKIILVFIKKIKSNNSSRKSVEAMTHHSLIKFPNKILTPGEFSFKNLNGLFCLYKPPDMNLEEITKKLKHYLVHGINKIPCRPVDKIVKIDEKNDDLVVDIDYSDRVEGKMKNILFRKQSTIF